MFCKAINGSSNKMALEEHARLFATAAHAAIGQLRKYTETPYIEHPAAVVAIVRSRPHTPEMIAAAWLHDVVEDTDVSIELIQQIFGEKVAEIVSDLTDVSKPGDGNRMIRKLVDYVHTEKACVEAKTVKLADLIDNTKSIVERDPGFAKVYLEEKRRLLEVLRDGDPVLWEIAFDQTKEMSA